MNSRILLCLVCVVFCASAVKQSVTTLWGTYLATEYVAISNTDSVAAAKYGAKSGDSGATITISFTPNAKVNCEKIGLVQMVLESVKNGVNYDIQCLNLSPTAGQGQKTKCARSDGKGHLDRSLDAKNPVYGAEHTKPGRAKQPPTPYTLIADTPERCSISVFKRSMPNAPGCHYQLGKKVGKAVVAAKLLDTPTTGTAAKAGDKFKFEAAAICIKGAQVGQVYGSVKWGFFINPQLKSVVDAFGVAARTGVSQQFTTLSTKWNTITDVIKLPTFKVGAPTF